MTTRILLVEDNETNRDMLARRLLRRGYEVILAEDGQIALDKARAETPDIILLDLSLPVMDGWEAMGHLRADASTAQIPIIVLTAHALVSDRNRAFELGCDDFDTKPVDLKRLLEKIETALAKRA